MDKIYQSINPSFLRTSPFIPLKTGQAPGDKNLVINIYCYGRKQAHQDTYPYRQNIFYRTSSSVFPPDFCHLQTLIGWNILEINLDVERNYHHRIARIFGSIFLEE